MNALVDVRQLSVSYRHGNLAVNQLVTDHHPRRDAGDCRRVRLG